MRPLDEGAMAAARARQARLAGPPGSLGRLEGLAVWMAGVTGSERPVLRARVVVATGRGATRARASSLAAEVDADVVLAEAGPSRDVTAQPALEVAEVALAVDAGRELAARAADEGVTVLAGGAQGIGNGTPATCLASVLTGVDVARLVGPGTGLDDCERALALHPDAARGPLHALRRLGSGGIAVLCGLALGAGEHGLGYVCDGLTATAAAAVAAAIEPGLRPRLLAGHRSPEPAHAALLEHLGLEPVLDLGLRGDDGSGAIAALAVLRLALAAHEDPSAGA